MKKHWCILWITILGLGFTVGVGSRISAAPRIFHPFECTMEPISYDPKSGHLVLELGVAWDTAQSIDAACNGTITVQISELDGLSYGGQQQWEVPVEWGAPPVISRLDLRVPPDDTSGLLLITECASYTYNWPRYFITSGDSITAVWTDPRKWIDRPPLPDSVETRLRQEEVRRQLAEQRKIAPPPPEGVGSYDVIIYPGDSALADSLTDEGKGKLSRMRAKESTPLTDSEQESYAVEGRWFFRLRGESRFRPLPGFTKEELHQRYRQRTDSLAAADTSHYNVILDLRAPGALESARDIVDSLVPTDSAGFYRTSIKRMIFRELLNQGIPCQQVRDPAGDHRK